MGDKSPKNKNVKKPSTKVKGGATPRTATPAPGAAAARPKR